MTAEKQKILMIIRPAEGGMVSHLQALINNLAGDFAITLACPEKQAAKYSALPCEILSLPLAGNLRPVWDAAVFCRLYRLLKKNDFSLIHAHGFKAGLLARPLSRIFKIPCLLTVHGDFLRAKLSRLPGAYMQAERCLSRWTAGYVAVSGWLAGELYGMLGAGKSKIRVIPNGIETAGFYREKGCRKSDSFLVGTAARLVPEKGLDVFLKAASCLKPRFPEISFVIAGDGPLRLPLEEMSRQLGVQDRVVFLGHCERIPEFLAGLDVFVMPSRSEGQGIAVLEAMAAGCPVVASSAGGLRELIRHGENGLLFPVGDAQVLADCIASCLQNPEYAAVLAARARREVAKRSSRQTAEETKKPYYSILEGRGRL